jgi:cyanophycinase
VIAGGGALGGTGIMERFIALAGGANAKIVVVPTAGGNRNSDGTIRPYDAERVLANWRAMGLTNVHMLHTHDRAIADTDSFASQLHDATGVWFNGGRQWNIVDSYAGTRTYHAFHAVLARGGVIGGSSAGATIQGAYLVRGAVAGPHIVMTDEPEHQDAFNFLRRSAIDQHVDARNRWNDLIPVMDTFPDYIGIGISEGTAVVVRGDTMEVMGKAAVAVHDRTRPRDSGGEPFDRLAPGTRYDLANRRIISLPNATSADSAGTPRRR